MPKLIAFRAYEFDIKVIYAINDNFITDQWLSFGYVDFIIDQWQNAHEKVDGEKENDTFCNVGSINKEKCLCKSNKYLLFLLFISFLLTINLKLIIVHVEIKIVNKEAATKRSTLLHAQRHACMVVHGRCTIEQSDVMLIRKGKRKEDN